MKKYLLAGILVVVLAIVLMQSLQISAIKSQLTGSAVTGNAMDTSGWTDDELMNYEMHGIIPARAGRSAASSSAPQMVGGC